MRAPGNKVKHEKRGLQRAPQLKSCIKVTSDETEDQGHGWNITEAMKNDSRGMQLPILSKPAARLKLDENLAKEITGDLIKSKYRSQRSRLVGNDYESKEEMRLRHF